MVPEDVLIQHGLLGCSSTLLVAEDVLLAVDDHLVSDLDKEASHPIICIVVSGDGVDHLDAIHKGRKGVLNCFGSAVIKGLDELFKSSQVLHVVLCFIKSFCDFKLNTPPLGGSQIDFISGLSELFTRILRSLSQDVIDSSAVLAS